MRSTPTLAAAVLVAACGATPGVGPHPTPAPVLADGERFGTLTYKELPAAMSVEAYLGVEFTLENDGGGALALEAGEAVSRGALVQAAGQRVALRCTVQAPVQPEPGSAYPTGLDGAPLPRPAFCRVTSLRTLPGR